jgi:hypothetical protein
MTEQVIIEHFMPIPDYEGLYEVSNTGRIKSLARTVSIGLGRKQSKPNLYKKQHIGIHGYYSTGLSNGGKTKTVLVHRIVAEAFLPNPQGFRCVNHKDGNKLNNNLDNLEWCSHSQNEIHAYETGLKKGAWFGRRGSAHPRARTVKQLSLSGQLIRLWDSMTEAATQLGIRSIGISSVCAGYDKTYKGFKWEYNHD